MKKQADRDVEESLSVAVDADEKTPTKTHADKGGTIGGTIGDEEIERRMIAAEMAGRTTVADALARQLDDRRRACEARSNVVAIETAKRGRR